MVLVLSDSAFEGNAEKFLGFNGKLHRQFVEHFFGVAVDDEADGVLSLNAALVAVKELVLTDFGSGSFVLHDGSLVVDIHVGEGVGAALVAQQQRVALAIVACAISFLAHSHKASVGIGTMTC